MFVEIAPRQNGKIQRLVDDAIKYLNSHQNTVINLVSYSEPQSEQIKDKIMEKIQCGGDRIIISNSMKHQTVMGSRVVKNYIYGFDLMREVVNCTTCLFIDEDAYYTSSIASCTEFTKRLITYYKKSYSRKKRIEDIIGDE